MLPKLAEAHHPPALVPQVAWNAGGRAIFERQGKVEKKAQFSKGLGAQPCPEGSCRPEHVPLMV